VLLARATDLATHSEEVLPILRERCHALHLAGHWEELLSVLQFAARIRRECTSVTVEHTEEELLEVEARWRIGCDLGSLYKRVLCCVSSSAASTGHRVQAAALALMFADNLCRRDEISLLFPQISPLLEESEIDEPIRQRLLMVYHCIFGELAQAMLAAEALVELERKRAVPDLCRALRHAGLVARTNGLMREAVAFTVESFERAQRTHLRRESAYSAFALVDIALHLGHYNEAASWLEKARSSCDQPPAPPQAFDLYVFDAELALAAGRFETAARSLEKAQHAVSPNWNMRFNAAITALRCKLRLLRDGELSDDEMATLLDLHFRTRDWSRQDRVAVVAYRGLVSRGAESQARDLLTEYLKRHRREHSPLSRELADISASISASLDN
jgi:tetratricopeptide (TPR) repeat protein